MLKIIRSALILHSDREIFQLINDVESYPNFVPWCVEANIFENNEKEMIASLTIEKGGITQSFTTHNYFEKYSSVKLELVEGPFNHLSGHWDIHALTDHACKVSLEINIEFHNKLVSMSLTKAVENTANKIVDAFCLRADDVYGS